MNNSIQDDPSNEKLVNKLLFQSVSDWARNKLTLDAETRDEFSSFDEKLYAELDRTLGVMNTTLPESLNGANLDISAPIAVIQALSQFDPAFAISYLSQELLFTHQLYHTWQDLNLPLPPSHAECLKSKAIAGMAMTEPNAGTDVLSMKTTATACRDGFILNGTKQWITNATIGQHFLVYARTGEGRKDISLFLVDSHIPGFHASPSEKKLGMRSSPTGTITFSECFIPQDALVGRLNDGVRPMIRNLAVERLGLAAQSVGIAQACLDTMVDYANRRSAFGKKIEEFGQIQKMIAESYAKYRAMQSLLDNSTQRLLQAHPYASIDADATKLFCAQTAEEIARNAIQVLGANGYSCAYPVQRLFRDAILLAIGGGTNEALQKNITRQISMHRQNNG